MKKIVAFIIILILVGAIGYISFKGYQFLQWQQKQVELLKLETIELRNKLRTEAGQSDYWYNLYLDESNKPPETEYVPYQVPDPSVHCTTWGSCSTRYTDCY